MVGIPLGGMAGECRVGGGLELHAEQLLLVGGNERRTARWALGREIAARPAQSSPPRDRALAHLEEADDVAARHTAVERIQHTLSQIG